MYLLCPIMQNTNVHKMAKPEVDLFSKENKFLCFKLLVKHLHIMVQKREFNMNLCRATLTHAV